MTESTTTEATSDKKDSPEKKGPGRPPKIVKELKEQLEWAYDYLCSMSRIRGGITIPEDRADRIEELLNS